MVQLPDIAFPTTGNGDADSGFILVCKTRECGRQDAISVIETDCEVDFAPPLDYVEPTRDEYAASAAAAAGAAAAPPPDASASAPSGEVAYFSTLWLMHMSAQAVDGDVAPFA